MTKQHIIIEKNYPARRTLTAVLAFMFLMFVSSILLIPFMFFLEDSQLFVVALIATIVSELIVIAVGLNYNGQFDRWKEVLGLVKPKLKSVIFGLLIGVTLFFGLQLLAFVMESLGVSLSSSDTSTSLGGLEGISRVIILMIVAPFVIPFVEELFFRGFIMGSIFESSISDEWKNKAAVIISSLAFSLAHFQGASTLNDLVLMLWIFVVAVINALLFLRYKSIFVPYAAHLSYNLVTVIATIAATQ